MEEWDKELNDLHIKNGDLGLRNQNLECELAKLAAINPRKSEAIGPDLSKVDVGVLLNHVKDRHYRSKANLKDMEAIMDFLVYPPSQYR